MGFASASQKEEIRSRIPLEDVVREYSIALAPSGRKMKGLCPFHAEKTPSFTVDIERQFYYCFGCQAKGDLFDFVQKMDHLDFPDALETLARRAGVTLESRSPRRGDESRVAVADALERAQEFYHQFLLREPAARSAREYLERRGIEPRMWETFRLGYAPPDGDVLVRRARAGGIPESILEKAGLVRRRQDGRDGVYDSFRGRLMFPIGDGRGRVIGFGARTLGDDVPKYLNTPRTELFDKSQVLYGLSEARRGIQREGCVAIVEGYTDAIIAHQAGLDFVVASLGTAFTAENARRLGRLAPRVLLVFDGDAAGQKASERSLDLLVAERLDVRVYTVTEGKDPADAILAVGGDTFRERLEAESVGIFEFKWHRTVAAEDAVSGGAALQARALDEFLGLLSKVPNVVARKLYAREFAEKIGIPEGDIEKRLREIERSGRRPRDVADAAGGQAVDNGNGNGSGRPGLEDVLLECVLALPDRVGEILSLAPPEFFRDPVLRALVEGVARQSENGTYSPDRLVQATDDPEAHERLLGLLGRLETVDGSPACDYEEVWRYAQRDIGRHGVQRRVDELRQMMDGERERGGELFEQHQREYFELIRSLKRARKG